MFDTTEKRDYHFIIDNLTDGFAYMKMTFDKDGQPIDICFHDINAAYEKQTGLKRDQAVGHSLSEYMSGHMPEFLERYGRLVKMGEPLTFEQYDENTGRWYDVKAYSLHKDNEFFSFFSDITSKKEQEKKNGKDALRKSEEKYRLLFENMTEIFQILEPLFNDEGRVFDFRYIEVNKATEVLAGKKREEMEGRTALELFGFVEDYWLEMIERALNTREPVHLTEYSKAVDLYYDVNAWKASEGKVAIVFSNITENKRDEKALRASEERMRVLVNCIPDEVWFAEKDKIVTLVNPAVLREFGEALHGVRVEKIASSLEVYRPDGSPRPIEEAPLLRALSGEVVRNQEEIIRIPARDELRYRQVNASPVIDAGGYIIGSVTIVRDITEQKKAEEALRESGERHAFLLKLSDALRQIDDPVQIQLTACRVLGEYIGVSRVLYGDVIDEKEVVISRDYCKGVPSIAATLHAADFSQFTIDSYKSGKPVIICDVSIDPRLNEAERSAYGSIHVAANISLGLVKNGKWMAAFGAHHNEPRKWTPLEISLMEETAERTWAAVERAKADDALLDKTRQLEESNREKEDILESISDCFYVLDKDLRFTYVNKPAEEIWGLSRSELIGRKIEDVFPGIIDISLSKFHQVLRERTQQHYEVYSKVIGRWGDMGVYPMRDGISVYFRDITERKHLDQHQALLSEISRELVGLNTIDETMGRLSEKIGRYFGVVWAMYAELVKDNEYSIASDGWNADGAISLKGKYRMRDFLSDEQLARNNAGELTIVSDTQADSRVSAETYGALGIKSFIILPISRDGQWRFQMSIIDNKPREWRDDEVDLFREIAQRIWARLERARTEEKLRESESLLITIIEGISEQVYLKDTQSRIILANSAVAQAQGQPLSNIIGKSDLEFFENKESGKMVLENDRRVMESNKIQVLEETVEVPDGVKTYLSTKVPWHDADGKVIGIFGISRDITDRKNMEFELKRTADELQQADKKKNEFISVLSHELRNPLAAISAGVQILDITQDAGQTNKVKEVIKRQTNQLCKLVDDLLELTRITQNKIKLKKENINLNEIIYGSVEDIKPEYEKKGVRLLTKLQPGSVLLNADPVRINQIIGNILFNALKFTQAKGTVFVTLKTTKDEAVISIKDSGIGISPEILPHLFTPFTQADHSLDRSNGGLGLGLSIVKGIVDLHEGNVSAFSEGLGKGSTFEIRLPRNKNGGAQQPDKMPAEMKDHSLKILLIDDNQDFSDLLGSALTLLGHEVITANDGMTGIAKAKDFSPDVIFCDIGLPEMDGFEVVKRVRGEASIQNVYMVALTGYANRSDTDKALESGFNKHLAKPVDINTIRKVLSDIGS